MYRTIAVVFIFGLSSVQSQLIPNDLLDKIPGAVDVKSLNETALGQVENAKNQFKSKCEKNGGPDAFDKVIKANEQVQNCVKGLVNMTELQDEIEKAKPTGDLDIVFKKYCMKKTTLKKCVTDFTSTVEACLEPQERDTVKIGLNVTDSLLNFICHKEVFIAAGGPECFASQQAGLQQCLNSTYGGYLPTGDSEKSAPSLESLPKLAFGINECRGCVVTELEKCTDPTPGNIADALFTFVKRVTPCENLLAARSAPLVEDPNLRPRNSAPISANNVYSFLFVSAALALMDESDGTPFVYEHRMKHLDKPSEDTVLLTGESKGGLSHPRALLFLGLWYIFSGCTLFLNKYILSYMEGDPTILGAFQMITTAVCGFIQMYFPCGMYKTSPRLVKPPGFYRHMILVGCTRFTTVVLGLIALNYVAVSFTETIKSSAPLFTVLISRYLLGERTGLYVNLSLIPVMGGLALCSVNELSFDFKGFIAAMATNLTECLQNPMY
ncbi:Similar to Slc35e2a: Solute carrier family 35 member E2A (Mus musculus) [Cotesia congregata]|uniref:Similar to Slc35e2a: Solute carrier family 35 member E2A (Mus musculus) n=1 Tax=Cotesia congregata TaxID=51543 RepID=A0A8J2HPS6_COTCN|nr:Similar to Slc35e2a: Solute carrier family 35 member E2A (Mus musculus) [Cotesia congregata]